MKGGRKNLKRAAEEQSLSLQDGQIIMQVVSLRGSNLIEVMDAQGDKSLALFPAKFQKCVWIKRGNFVVVDESGREKATQSGCKVACIISRVLFYKQIHELQKSPECLPSIFKPDLFGSAVFDESNGSLKGAPFLLETSELDSSDDEGLPPLKANTNRIKPSELRSDSSGSDTDS